MSLLNDMGKFSEFTEEVQQELGHLNRTIPPYLSKLFGGDAVVNQFSDAICGKRGTILQEHRPEEGMARIVGWMLRVISTSGGDPSKNVTDPNLGGYLPLFSIPISPVEGEVIVAVHFLKRSWFTAGNGYWALFERDCCKFTLAL